MDEMDEIKPGDRFRLPSGNLVEVTAAKAEPGEYRCKYVEHGDNPLLGGAEAFGATCLLSAEFLQKHGVLRDGD